jgi:cell division septal protein FtsQ
LWLERIPEKKPEAPKWLVRVLLIAWGLVIVGVGLMWVYLLWPK